MGRIIRSFIQDVPVEYLPLAERDPVTFARTLGCDPVEALMPFFTDRDALLRSIDTDKNNPFDGISCSFSEEFVCRDEFRRYMHVDLGYKRDRCGLAMCHVPRGVSVSRDVIVGSDSFVDRRPLPFVQFDFVGVIQASPNIPIQFDAIIELIHRVAGELGFPLVLVTYDGWQSISSVQRLNREGYLAAVMSVDRTTKYVVLDVHEPQGFREESTNGRYMMPWEGYRDLILDGRVRIPFYNPCLHNRLNPDVTLYEEESMHLEEDVKKGKVDHPPNGSKDLMDAIVGAALSASINEWGIPERPEDLRRVSKQTKEVTKSRREDKFNVNLEREDKKQDMDLGLDDVFSDSNPVGF
ncbi:hypothetical protein C4561_01805 [candidate division WWE3 bacterium]|uniref:Uncharacterized protein n=1 Tax=candidate division WWE3 bacterium TaxID=2053526 RepID=A0A3A4ZEQ1_UNCKA|nr:MAG: hypothetical protein C4561_01805 [candidate division WWE3 bacterium]